MPRPVILAIGELVFLSLILYHMHIYVQGQPLLCDLRRTSILDRRLLGQLRKRLQIIWRWPRFKLGTLGSVVSQARPWACVAT